MAELALDDVDRHSFACELDGMRVTQLMGREPTPHPGVYGERAQFGAGGGRRPSATAGCSARSAFAGLLEDDEDERGVITLPAAASSPRRAAFGSSASRDQVGSLTRT